MAFFAVPSDTDLYYNGAYDHTKLIWIRKKVSNTQTEAKQDCMNFAQGDLYSVENSNQFEGIEKLIRETEFEILKNDNKGKKLMIQFSYPTIS